MKSIMDEARRGPRGRRKNVHIHKHTLPHMCNSYIFFNIYPNQYVHHFVCVCGRGGGSQSNLSTKHDCLASVIDAEEQKNRDMIELSFCMFHSQVTKVQQLLSQPPRMPLPAQDLQTEVTYDKDYPNETRRDLVIIMADQRGKSQLCVKQG